MDESFNHDFGEELGTALNALGAILSRFPVPIDMQSVLDSFAADSRSGVAELTLKLYQLVRAEPLPEPVDLVAEGCVAAWATANMIAFQLERVTDPTAREMAHESYHWLLGDMSASLSYLNDWVNGDLPGK